MKTKRRLLISLMVITAMTVTGFSVSFAAGGTQGTVIEKVELANDVKPAAGAVPAAPKAPADAGYTVDDFGWYVIGDTEAAPVAGAFEAGHLYQLKVTYAVKEGYEINPETHAVRPDGCSSAATSERTVTEITVHYDFPLAGGDVIPVVELKDVDPPCIGGNPDMHYSLPEGAGYQVESPGRGQAGYLWFVLNGGYKTGMGPLSTFEAGKAYELQVYFKAEEGKELSEMTQAVLPSGFESLEVDYIRDWEALRVRYKTTAKAPTLIETLDLTGLEAPEAGEKQDDVIIPDNDKFNLTEKTWYRLNRDGYRLLMQSNETFREGETYRVFLTFAPGSGYLFDENAVVAPDALKDAVVDQIMEGNRAVIELEFAIPESTGPADPDGQTDPADPDGQTDPADPDGQTDPADPDGQTDPADPDGQTDPADPNGQTDPAGPDDQTGSDQNVNEEAVDSDQAQTGDESSMMPWILLMTGALAGAVIILRNRRHN